MNRNVVGLLACFAVLSTLGAAQAATLYVANNGVDGGGCGAQTNPCRSIGRAIANATADDTIIVGSGLYGNLGYDFTEAGEEPGPAACGSLICVDKPLTIVSSREDTAECWLHR